MRRDACWFIVVVSVVVLGNLRSSDGQKAEAPAPATDERYCADSNGDGRLDISDAVDILQFLFTGESVPHCVAAGEGLDGFATQADLTALEERRRESERDD